MYNFRKMRITKNVQAKERGTYFNSNNRNKMQFENTILIITL